jgi:hypothetical protein
MGGSTVCDRTEPDAGGQAGEAVKRTAHAWESAEGRWCLTITTFPPTSSAQDHHYHLIPERGEGGRAFTLIDVMGDGTRPVYRVALTADRPMCSCPDSIREPGKLCPILSALLALQARGKLDKVLPPPVNAAGRKGGAA